jgi:hypothetical protein
MPPALFNVVVNVYQRASTGNDSLNNPIYGTPTSGAGWSLVYANMPCKLAFSSKQIQFAMTGERPKPSGVVYYGSSFTLAPEYRIVTTDPSPIEYVVVSVVPAYIVAAVVDHYEAIVELP